MQNGLLREKVKKNTMYVKMSSTVIFTQHAQQHRFDFVLSTVFAQDCLVMDEFPWNLDIDLLM